MKYSTRAMMQDLLEEHHRKLFWIQWRQRLIIGALLGILASWLI